jgi:hypothetical protein
MQVIRFTRECLSVTFLLFNEAKAKNFHKGSLQVEGKTDSGWEQAEVWYSL